MAAPDCTAQADVVVVGAGVVGLAIARRLASLKMDVVVIERHDSFGRETSSRNSEVIHAGLYYPPGTLKARLCVEGGRALYEWCDRMGVAHNRCGKLVVAVEEREQEVLAALADQGTRNGVEGIEIGGREMLAGREPDAAGISALWSPSTGILDTHGLMASLEAKAKEEGAVLAYRCQLRQIDFAGKYRLDVTDSDGSSTRLQSDIVVNSAGLESDRVAALAGIDVHQAGYQLSYCKGEYFRVSARHRGRLSHLVYPAPAKHGLGIHTVPDFSGGLRLGPNAFYVLDSTDLSVAEDHAVDFYKAAHAYLPFLSPEDLTPDQSGVRPKLQKEDEAFRDFVIAEESGRGLPGLINLIGIESPGLTAALAIAEYVAALISGRGQVRGAGTVTATKGAEEELKA